MFCMISCGRRGSDASDDVGMTSLGRFQMEEEETEPREGWPSGSLNARLRRMIMMGNGKTHLKVDGALYEGDCEVHRGM